MDKIKSKLPLILFFVGLLVVGLGLFFVLRKPKDVEEEDTSSLIEVLAADRPVTTLTPTDDGHWLNLLIDKINIDAESVDYELLYQLPDGRTQGVPGTVTLDGSKIERELLLGSESSGKFRYDEGVEEGTLTLRFRNKKGKLLVKFSTDFILLSGTKKLVSTDNNFKFTLSSSSNEYFVVMETFGYPGEAPATVKAGPYGVFSSSTKALSGTPDLGSGTLYRWTGSKWNKVSKSSDTGIFITTE